MIIARLGFLFLRGNGRRGLMRLVFIVAGTALGVSLLLVALSLPGILGGRQERASSRWPKPALTQDTGVWYQRRTQLLGQGTLQELFLAGRGPKALLPPGVPRFPRPGEAFVSPAFAGINASAHVKAVFPYRRIGLVTPQGLISPDELYAVVGVSRDQLSGSGHRLGGYGLSGGKPEVDIAEGDLKVLQIALVGLVGVPLAVFFAVIARLSAASRDRRLAALRLLGMTQRDTRRVNAFEAIVGALVGSLVGLGIFAVAHARLAAAGLGRIVWFASDSRPSALTIVLCLAGIPLLAALLGTVGSREAVRNALAVRRQVPRRRSRWVRLVPLGIGLGLLLGLLIGASRAPEGAGLKDPGPLLMVVGILFTGLGLATGFTVLGEILAKAAAIRGRRLWLTLGARRLMFEPSSASRVVAGLIVVVFAVGFATGLQRDARAASLPLGGVELYQIEAREVPAAARMDLLRIADVKAAIILIPPVSYHTSEEAEGPAPEGSPSNGQGQGQQPGPPDPGISVTAGFASCRDLHVLFERPVPDCRDGTSYRVGEREEISSLPPAGRRFDLAGDVTGHQSAGSLIVPSEILVLTLSDLQQLGGINVLYPLSQLPDRNVPGSARLVLASATSTAAIGRVFTAMGRVAPVAQITLLNDDVAARQRSEVFQSLLNVALVLGIIVGILAFVVATLDRALERRPNLVSLAVVGVPISTLRASQAFQVFLPLAAGTILALISGKIAEQVAVVAGGYDRSWTWSGTLFGLGLGFACILLSMLATLPAATDRIDAALIRRE